MSVHKKMRFGSALLATGALTMMGTFMGVAVASAGTSGLATAQAYVKQHLAYPTKLGITQQLAAAPPKGKSHLIAYLISTTSSDQAIGNAIAAATKLLGWTVRDIQEGSTPASVAAAMSLAVSLHPTAVIGAGYPLATYPNQVAQLKKAGIPYVTVGTTDPTGSNGVTAVVGGGSDYSARGSAIAQWVIADSKGKAKVAIFNLSTYPVLNDAAAGFTTTVKAECPACKISNQNVVATTIGSTLPSQVVSYLKANPSVNYIFATYGDETIGLNSALAAAGLASKVKVVTQGGSSNLSAVAAGTQSLYVGESDTLVGWLTMDAVLRAVTKTPFTESLYAVTPSNLIVKSNVHNPSLGYIAIANAPALFKSLWRLG